MNTKAEVFPIFSLSLDVSHPTSHHSKNWQVFQFPPKGAGMQKILQVRSWSTFYQLGSPLTFHWDASQMLKGQSLHLKGKPILSFSPWKRKTPWLSPGCSHSTEERLVRHICPTRAVHVNIDHSSTAESPMKNQLSTTTQYLNIKKQYCVFTLLSLELGKKVAEVVFSVPSRAWSNEHTDGQMAFQHNQYLYECCRGLQMSPQRRWWNIFQR